MAMLWTKQIMLGRRSLAQVPRLLLDAVREQLAQMGVQAQEEGDGV